MEATIKPEKQQPSSFGILQKVLIFLVVLAVCVGFFVGLLLVSSRLTSLEETVNGLSEVTKRRPSGGKSQADILLSLASLDCTNCYRITSIVSGFAIYVLYIDSISKTYNISPQSVELRDNSKT